MTPVHASIFAGGLAGLEADRGEDRPFPGTRPVDFHVFRRRRPVRGSREAVLGPVAHQTTLAAQLVAGKPTADLESSGGAAAVLTALARLGARYVPRPHARNS